MEQAIVREHCRVLQIYDTPCERVKETLFVGCTERQISTKFIVIAFEIHFGSAVEAICRQFSILWVL